MTCFVPRWNWQKATAAAFKPLHSHFPAKYWGAEYRRIYLSYDLLIRHAEIINDREMANDALIDRSIEIEEAAEMVKHFDTKKLVKKCKKYGIFLSSIPVPEGKASIWRSDTLRSILYREAEEEIKKRLTAAKNERNQERRENLKVLAAVLGAVTGVIGALIGLVATLRVH